MKYERQMAASDGRSGLQHPRGLGDGSWNMGAGTANPLQLEQCMLSTSPSQRREDGFGDLDIPTTADAERPHETEGGVL
jgi:hypothetical protein